MAAAGPLADQGVDEDVIRRRQEVYAELTAPLIAHYSERDLVFEVDGSGEVDEVARGIFSVLEKAS